MTKTTIDKLDYIAHGALRGPFGESAESPHPIEDCELLARWEEGTLTKAEHEDIESHLVKCAECRERLALMQTVGRLHLKSSTPAPLSARAASLLRSRSFAAVCAGTAAAILIALFLRPTTTTDGRAELARLETLYEQGRYSEAIDSASELLNDKDSLSPTMRIRAEQVLSNSGYKLAGDMLAQSRFEETISMESRVKSVAGETSSLLNLRLQAERGFRDELTLRNNATLVDFGYELNGIRTGKFLPAHDATIQRHLDDYAAAVKRFPDSNSIRLNYGHLLIEQAKYDEAIEQFEIVQQRNPDNLEAEIGLGLTLFRKRLTEEALGHFQTALELSPDCFAANLNIGISHQSLGRPEEATPYFRKALAIVSTDNENIKIRLQRMLEVNE